MQTRYKEAALGGLATLNIIECCHSPLDTRRAFQRYTYT